MDRLQRSNSSISSRTGFPPDIVNEEDHIVEENELLDFQNGTSLKLVLKLFTKLVGLKILFILLTKLELLNKHFLFQKLMKNVACFLKEILMILLLKDSIIYILDLFKLLLNHSHGRVIMPLFSSVYEMLDLKSFLIAFLV